MSRNRSGDAMPSPRFMSGAPAPRISREFSRRLVAIVPGQMALVRTPFGPYARAMAMAPAAVRSIFAGERPRQPNDGVLGRGVRRSAAHGDQAGHRRDVD